MKTFTVLTLSGSLRKASLNTAMLTMAADCAPPGLCVNLPRGLGDLALFNPDLELHEPPSVARLRSEIAMADAVIIASPEYAHGVSGVMKNALDWMVATGVFVDKPVVLWNASPRASIALAALLLRPALISSQRPSLSECEQGGVFHGNLSGTRTQGNAGRRGAQWVLRTPRTTPPVVRTGGVYGR